MLQNHARPLRSLMSDDLLLNGVQLAIHIYFEEVQPGMDLRGFQESGTGSFPCLDDASPMVAQSHFDRLIRRIVQKEQVAARIWEDVHGAFFQHFQSAGSGIKRFRYCARDIATTVQDNIECRTPVKFQCY